MIELLNNIFKKYVAIFIGEYADYLSKEQLESLKGINFNNAIKLDSTSKPFGMISLGQVNLSDYSEELINSLKKMPNYNSYHYELNNKNMSSYLKYMCDSGYNLVDNDRCINLKNKNNNTFHCKNFLKYVQLEFLQIIPK